jgi:hypothetical protein
MRFSIEQLSSAGRNRDSGKDHTGMAIGGSPASRVASDKVRSRAFFPKKCTRRYSKTISATCPKYMVLPVHSKDLILAVLSFQLNSIKITLLSSWSRFVRWSEKWFLAVC